MFCSQRSAWTRACRRCTRWCQPNTASIGLVTPHRGCLVRYTAISLSCCYTLDPKGAVSLANWLVGTKEGNVLFNDALSTFYLRLYGVRHMVKDHSDSEKRRKEGNVLFNNALNAFYLRLYGVRHMVKDHSDSEREKTLPPHGLLFPINSKGSFICIIPQTG